MNPMPWSQRQLPFGKAPHELPYLLERMQGTPARAADLLRPQPIERLVLRAQGKWSPMEHLAHLLHLDHLLQARVDDFLARRPALCRIDLEGQHERIAAHRQRSPGDLLEEFRITRGHLVRRMRAMDAEILSHRASHPCMGIAYSPADMALWIAEHDDHHLLSARLLLGAIED
jgi:hypothetical protein